MLDLETLGNKSGCMIKSIGAVKFNAQGITDSFYGLIDLDSCLKAGLKVDDSTVVWWLKESTQALEQLAKPGFDIQLVLLQFANWVGSEGAIVWGNGASFDMPIIENAYQAVGVKCPWHFSDHRCYRTLKNIYPYVKMQRHGEAHNALDDATSQALHLLEMSKASKHKAPIFF